MAKKSPDSTTDAARLEELGRDERSVFFFLAFLDKEMSAILKELGTHVPGFRMDKLSGAERADVLADEVAEFPDARKKALALLRKVYEFPAFDRVALSKEIAAEFAALAVESDATVRMLWRVLADPDAEVRAQAVPALQKLVKQYYGKGGVQRRGPDRGGAAASGGDVAGLAAEMLVNTRSALDGALAELKRSKEREQALKDDAAGFRKAIADGERAAAALRKERDELAKRVETAEAKAAEPKESSAAVEKARRDLEAAKARIEVVEERLRASEFERDGFARRLAAAESKQTSPAPQPAAAAPAAEPEDEPAPATWLVPRFSREFYDSIERWDNQAQRLAFKQALLLAENHRHPSLRAIPLEGLDGYYRVRVASDLRLIYRRGDKGEVEILSLIDREDLDRYVRTAKKS